LLPALYYIIVICICI